MKLHLPKLLLTALIAAASIPVASGEDYTVIKKSDSDKFDAATFSPDPTDFTEGNAWKTFSDANTNWKNHTLRFEKSSGGDETYLLTEFNNFCVAGMYVDSVSKIAGLTGDTDRSDANMGGRTYYLGHADNENQAFTFNRSFEISPGSKIVLDGTQTWTIGENSSVALIADTITNNGAMTVTGGELVTGASSTITNNGTMTVTGGELVISSTVGGSGALSTSGTGVVKIADINGLRKRLVNSDFNNLESNGMVDVAISRIVADGGITGKIKYTKDGTETELEMNNETSFTDNITAYAVTSNTSMSAIADDVNTNGGSYIVIKKDVTITKDSGFTFNDSQRLIGDGTYDLGNVGMGASTAPTASLLGANVSIDPLWTGKVSLSGGQASSAAGDNSKSVQALDFNVLGVVGSTVEIGQDGVYCYLSSSTTYNPDILLTGDLTIQNGNSNYAHTFAGRITGSGSLNLFSICPSAGGYHNLTFTNDISGWRSDEAAGDEAAIVAKDCNGESVADLVNNVTLTGGATEVNVEIVRQSGILNLIVNNTVDTTFNKDVTVSKLTATGICLGAGVDITLTGSTENSSISKVTADTTGNTITLNQGATLNRIATVTGGTVTLKGNGIYNMGNASTANVSGLCDATWEGKVVFAGQIANLNLESYGHSGSSIELKGWDGYFNQSATADYAADIVLTDGSNGYAVKITDGYSTLSDNTTPTKYTFSGNIGGTGIWQMARNNDKGGSVTQNYIFTGDISEWSGQFLQSSVQHTTNLTFTGTDEVNVAIVKSAEGGELNVTIDDSELAAGTKILLNSSITADSLTLGNAKDTDANRAQVSIGENISVGSLTTYATTTVANGKALSIGGAATVSSADGTGAVTLTGQGENGGSVQRTADGVTLSNLALDNAKITGASSDTMVNLQDVRGAVTLSTGVYALQAVTGTAAVAVEADEVATLNYTLGDLTAITLASDDAKLVIDVDNMGNYPIVLNLNVGKGADYTLTWDAESLSQIITFSGELGELLARPDTQYTMVDVQTPAMLAVSPSELIPSVVYGMNNGVLTSITISMNIPEPTTATLSLLALAGLAARRRRR